MPMQTADLRPWRHAGSPFAVAGAGKPADDHVHQAVAAREKIPVPVPAKMRDAACSRGRRSATGVICCPTGAPGPYKVPPGPPESLTISRSRHTGGHWSSAATCLPAPWARAAFAGHPAATGNQSRVRPARCRTRLTVWMGCWTGMDCVGCFHNPCQLICGRRRPGIWPSKARLRAGAAGRRGRQGQTSVRPGLAKVRPGADLLGCPAGDWRGVVVGGLQAADSPRGRCPSICQR